MCIPFPHCIQLGMAFLEKCVELKINNINAIALALHIVTCDIETAAPNSSIIFTCLPLNEKRHTRSSDISVSL